MRMRMCVYFTHFLNLGGERLVATEAWFGPRYDSLGDTHQYLSPSSPSPLAPWSVGLHVRSVGLPTPSLQHAGSNSGKSFCAYEPSH